MSVVLLGLGFLGLVSSTCACVLCKTKWARETVALSNVMYTITRIILIDKVKSCVRCLCCSKREVKKNDKKMKIKPRRIVLEPKEEPPLLPSSPSSTSSNYNFVPPDQDDDEL
jgi:hypothetical protein